MQLELPFTRRQREQSRAPVLLHRGGTAVSVHLVRTRGARRYILRVRPDGALRVTVPRGGSRREALQFVENHFAWALRERARILALPSSPRAWTPGMQVLLDGDLVEIVREQRGPDWIVRVGACIAKISGATIDVRPPLERALRELARRQLPWELLALARMHRLDVSRITIRNQRWRWGSCSPNGRIALNFRLVQMPPKVREYILLHELMHLRQPNHSRRFWSLMEGVCPEFRNSERWLKTNGRMLY